MEQSVQKSYYNVAREHKFAFSNARKGRLDRSSYARRIVNYLAMYFTASRPQKSSSKICRHIWKYFTIFLQKFSHRIYTVSRHRMHAYISLGYVIMTTAVQQSWWTIKFEFKRFHQLFGDRRSWCFDAQRHHVRTIADYRYSGWNCFKIQITGVQFKRLLNQTNISRSQTNLSRSTYVY